MKIFTVTSLTTIISYVGLFAFVFFPVMCFFAFTAFIGQTIISLILYIMIQDTIDYNEYKFGERRESATFALRAFAAKIAGSVQQGVLYLFLVGSSLLVVSNQIANWEREFAGLKDVILQHASQVTGAENIELWQRIVFQIGFTVVPMLLFLATFLIIKLKYKITEESHAEMLKEIEAKKHAVSE